ncbi:ABC1 family-domain-containing protein [Vararia minispora EC-137]|uniref:ABC1 family-domain-containing protein n=1 Tax=Vararia minispora EC-137 TaxID=1314806 RepID=A0ACB8QBH0_9AGAM|nr:ABC1 family-domain-containing protein [Vararia minispora EC-137]
MPPGTAYNWLAVAHSFAQIIEYAAQYRAAQLNKSALMTSSARPGGKETATLVARALDHPPFPTVHPSSLHGVNEAWYRALAIPALPEIQADSSELAPAPASKFEDDLPTQTSPSLADDLYRLQPAPAPLEQPSLLQAFHPDLPVQSSRDESSLRTMSTSTVDVSPGEASLVKAGYGVEYADPISSRVPSSRIGRFFHYGGLAASLGYGAASEFLRRSRGTSEGQSSSVLMTEANVSRLVNKLSRMRGAALKVGQFLSIQDTHVLPPEVDRVFRRVQNSAHYMPNWQMEKVFTDALGASWRTNFASFDPIPFAAASIGQVHRAVLAAAVSPTGRDEPVAVKVQFPNIRESVESDIGYLKVLLTAGRLLPKGLFLDKTIAAMKEELADECNYTREAQFLREFGDNNHLGGDPKFKVPWVWDGSTSTVLVMEHVGGVSVGDEEVGKLSRVDKDDIAARIIELCLKELFVFRAMQTDPNWTNFLWNVRTRQIELVDFGATRVYTKEFMDDWLRLLRSAASGDFEACKTASLRLGYLTGEENDAMLNAHITSMELLATPFRSDTPQPFAFGPGTRWAEITAKIREQIPVMLEHRLTPPPRETYSLNRKLSGAFLLASRLEASVDCHALWDQVTSGYKFEPMRDQ